MEREDMYEFFEVVIEPCLMAIEKKFDEYKHCFKVRREKRDKDKIYDFYQCEREKIYCYMETKVKALDGHKVAACFIYALIKHKLVKINKLKGKIPTELLMSNEYLACTVALNIVAMYHRKNTGDNDFELIIPKTNHDELGDESAFVPNFCKALYYIRSLSSFDPFAYSNILFLLEKYTEVVSK